MPTHRRHHNLDPIAWIRPGSGPAGRSREARIDPPRPIWSSRGLPAPSKTAPAARGVRVRDVIAMGGRSSNPNYSESSRAVCDDRYHLTTVLVADEPRPEARGPRVSLMRALAQRRWVVCRQHCCCRCVGGGAGLIGLCKRGLKLVSNPCHESVEARSFFFT